MIDLFEGIHPFSCTHNHKFKPILRTFCETNVLSWVVYLSSHFTIMIPMTLNQLNLSAIPDRVHQDQVRRVLQAALSAADPARAVRSALRLEGGQLTAAGRTYDLAGYRRILVTGMGKAVVGMARGLLDALPGRVMGGLLVPKHLPEAGALPPAIQLLPGQHPVPGPLSLAAARGLMDLLSICSADDLVFCLVSGGGSALLSLPDDSVSLEDMQQLTRLLLASGAEIGEINTLRKHLDRVKGGGLARMAAPASLVTLILSDVIGSPLSSIASGPTAPDPTTFADALTVLDKYRLREQVPASIRAVLEAGALGNRPETLKEDNPVFRKVQNVLVASNEHSARAAVEQARADGFNALLLTTSLSGEAREAGSGLADVLRRAARTGDPLPRPCCIVAGGETTVTLRGGGTGGRNQEVALGALAGLAGLEDVALVTLATDGEDGPTDAAGALVTGQSLDRAQAAGLDVEDALRRNDSYTFFQALGSLLHTGPTGTNVNDLTFLFAF